MHVHLQFEQGLKFHSLLIAHKAACTEHVDSVLSLAISLVMVAIFEVSVYLMGWLPLKSCCLANQSTMRSGCMVFLIVGCLAHFTQEAVLTRRREVAPLGFHLPLANHSRSKTSAVNMVCPPLPSAGNQLEGCTSERCWRTTATASTRADSPEVRHLHACMQLHDCSCKHSI